MGKIYNLETSPVVKQVDQAVRLSHPEPHKLARDVPFRSALPGDFFVLLIPTGAELSALRRRQVELQQRYDGIATVSLHVTCERFHVHEGRSRPLPESELEARLLRLRNRLEVAPSFPVYANGLVSYYAQFWKTHVLRWRVLVTPACVAFQQTVLAGLEDIGAHSHYIERSTPTCNALEEVRPVHLPPEEAHQPPFPLFTARQVRISRLLPGNIFQTLHLFELT